MTSTARGFVVIRFQDDNGSACSLQESSSCRLQGMAWLGIDKVQPKVFRPGEGWTDVPMPTDGTVLLSARMHLSQSQVAALLPALQHFAERGTLPREDMEIQPGVGCPSCRASEWELKTKDDA